MQTKVLYHLTSPRPDAIPKAPTEHTLCPDCKAAMTFVGFGIDHAKTSFVSQWNCPNGH